MEYTNKDNKEYADEIDINSFLRFLKRNKKLIFGISAGLTFLNMLYTSSLEKIYVGKFEIFVKEKSNNNSSSFSSNLPFFGLVQNQDLDQLTQMYILKSQSVLLPVFDSLKENYKTNENYISFNDWVKNHLDIDFVRVHKY